MAERDPDPIVMYIVVRRSLNLSAGKVGGQCGHAVHYFLTSYYESDQETEDPPAYALATEWLKSPDHTKVILGATDEEFEQVKQEALKRHVVTDLGRTQVAPNTQTCLGIWPMRKSARSPLLAGLKPL